MNIFLVIVTGVFYHNFTMQKLEKYKGVKLASGQEIFSQHLIIDSSSTIPSVLPPLEREGLNASNLTQKVARGVCIASSSLQRDLSNILVIFPPRCKIYASLFTYDHAFRMIIYMPACQLYPYFLLFYCVHIMFMLSN